MNEEQKKNNCKNNSVFLSLFPGSKFLANIQLFF